MTALEAKIEADIFEWAGWQTSIEQPIPGVDGWVVRATRVGKWAMSTTPGAAQIILDAERELAHNRDQG